ncbi:uncharacterized protein E0L32_012255 [Thyridium curvatum]|uniref:Uncharacterized protein n=1 Tax=Thyridium curvatum TaxID=1093900 RepID=A0A507BKV3_9PEZI|nr:uncharacterized protein E0L32_012255 [Thyridium curvatum]TPX17288.1 hypothetical protein E0L32_012255 [Thyridium curvatum]
MLDELSRGVAPVQRRRSSRGSNGQRIGGHMRIGKPSTSTNTSPRHSMMQARRRTLINDGLMAKRVEDQAYLLTPGSDSSNFVPSEPSKRAPRPVSWHPSSHMVQHQVPLQQPVMQMPYAPYSQSDLLMGFPQFPPTPAAYSEYNSPAGFSPLALPTSFTAFEQPSYFAMNNNWNAYNQAPASEVFPSPAACPQMTEPFSVLSGSSETSPPWEMHQVGNMGRCTAPPTPENFSPAQQQAPQVSSDEPALFPPLDDEEEGEILIGMGLYDPPEKEAVDPALGNYMASVASHLGPNYPREPTGKGLKLEDAWEPPEMSDGEDDGDKDAEGEDQDD